MRLAVSALYDAVVGQIFYPIGVDRSADAAYAAYDTYKRDLWRLGGQF